MLRTLGLALAAAFMVQAAPSPETLEAGKTTFIERCAECHDVGDDRAPSREVLATKTTAEIVATLTTGMMAPMAEGLSDADKAAVAAYLTAGK